MRPNDEPQGSEARADVPGLGKTLADARAQRGLTIEEIATELRVEPRLLRALEQCKFDVLGPPVFAKGYLKQYGNRLGLKYPDLLAEYYRLVEPREVTLAPSRTIKLRDERQITVWIIAALALALLGVFLMVWWFGEPPATLAPVPAAPESSEAATPVATDAAVAPREEPRPPEPATGDRRAEPGAAESTEPSVLAEEAAGEPLDSAGGAATIPAAVPQALANEPALVVAPGPPGPSMTIEFAFLEDCWLEATDARGARLFYGLGEAGARRRVSGEPPIDVILGNANGVAVTVDGEPYVVPARNRQGNLARFVVDVPTD